MEKEKYYWIQEAHVDNDDNCLLSQDDTAQESYIKQGSSLKDIKKELLKDFKTPLDYSAKRKNLKISPMYIDTEKGQPQKVGFVIDCQESYTDQPDKFFNKSIWLTFHNKEPVKIVTWDKELASL